VREETRPNLSVFSADLPSVGINSHRSGCPGEQVHFECRNDYEAEELERCSAGDNLP
jgi:hypothetical protein